MNILVVGSGGREHALVKALRMKGHRVFVSPGSDAIAQEAEKITIDCLKEYNTSMDRVTDVLKKMRIELVVIGPEQPLVDGFADRLREGGFLVFGPDSQGAKLEGSKIFAKEFMNRYGVPTAMAVTVKSKEDVLREHTRFTPPYVLKADGLAAGKGVVILQTLPELLTAAEDYFEKRIFGDAGASALLEQFQAGWELSFLILTNGIDFVPLPLAQDHKRLKDNGEGPNTGGMGVVAPLVIDEDLRKQILSTIVAPSVRGLSQEKFVFRGLLYIGVMVTDSGPKVIEYNVRFGDPEAQALLPLLQGDWAECFESIAKGDMPKDFKSTGALQWLNQNSVVLVLAAEGYPESPVKDVTVEFKSRSADSASYFLHAGTRWDGPSQSWVTAGGRVLNVVGLGETKRLAFDRAYQRAKEIQWPGMQKRSDIGKNWVE